MKILDPPGENLSNIPLFWHLPTTEPPSSGHKQRRQTLANFLVCTKRYFLQFVFQACPICSKRPLSHWAEHSGLFWHFFVKIPSHKILIGPCLIYLTHCFLFSTDIYGDGGRSDCCVEHDSILGERLFVSENQHYKNFWTRVESESLFQTNTVKFFFSDKDYLTCPLSHWLSSILLIVLLLFLLFLF